MAKFFVGMLSGYVICFAVAMIAISKYESGKEKCTNEVFVTAVTSDGYICLQDRRTNKSKWFKNSLKFPVSIFDGGNKW
jgi:hypothetical protein